MPESIAKTIDHAVLHPTQTDDDVKAACKLCIEVGTATVCVKPYHVTLAAKLLAKSKVGVSTVIGFPHGASTTKVKAAEARLACEQGATELDMVVNIGKVVAADWVTVTEDIRAVVAAAKESDAIVKVIFESGLIEKDELKIRLCQISEKAGAAFVKTSTGFGFVKGQGGEIQVTGATEHDIRLMREHTSEKVGVKASGGIRSYEDAKKFIDLGATRLGTSATQAIVAGQGRVESTY